MRHLDDAKAGELSDLRGDKEVLNSLVGVLAREGMIADVPCVWHEFGRDLDVELAESDYLLPLDHIKTRARAAQAIDIYRDLFESGLLSVATGMPALHAMLSRFGLTPSPLPSVDSVLNLLGDEALPEMSVSPSPSPSPPPVERSRSDELHLVKDRMIEAVVYYSAAKKSFMRSNNSN